MIETLLFYFFSIICIVSAFCVILWNSLIIRIFSLAITFLAVAGLLFMLQAPFLASIVIIVNIGAVFILFIFTLITSAPQRTKLITIRNFIKDQNLYLKIVGGTIFFIFACSFILSFWLLGTRTIQSHISNTLTMQHFADYLYKEFFIIIPLIGLLLIIVMITATLIIQRRWEKSSKIIINPNDTRDYS